MENNSSFRHKPVLLQAVRDLYGWDRPGLSVADFTVGGGGHLFALLKSCPRPERVLAVDQDPEALEAAREKLSEFLQIEFLHSNFRKISRHTRNLWDRIFVDLGVSSHQLDRSERGFSFQKDGPLDMRMNPTEGEPIREWLMQCDEKEFLRILQDYGEDPRARSVARKWCEVRKTVKIETTSDFVRALGMSFTSKDHRGRHPLTRVFQALRIQANDEMGALSDLLQALPSLLSPGGRVGILTFHSLEDREVKWQLRGKLKPINKKVIRATDEEIEENHRCRSAKFRVFEKE